MDEAEIQAAIERALWEYASRLYEQHPEIFENSGESAA